MRKMILDFSSCRNFLMARTVAWSQARDSSSIMWSLVSRGCVTTTAVEFSTVGMVLSCHFPCGHPFRFSFLSPTRSPCPLSPHVLIPQAIVFGMVGLDGWWLILGGVGGCLAYEVQERSLVCEGVGVYVSELVGFCVGRGSLGFVVCFYWKV